MNIVLIGYRGTGKSSVGTILADRLGKKYVGMDAEIVNREQMSVPDIVDRFGWPKFRDLESGLSRLLAQEDNLVIDTGGGIVERAENLEALGKNAAVFWLKASVESIVSRIKEDNQRPALTSGKTFIQEIEEVMNSRLSRYKNAADHEIDTDHLTPEQVADQISGMLQKNLDIP